MRTHPTFILSLLAVCGFLAAGSLLATQRDSAAPLKLKTGVPVEASVDQLRSFAGERDGDVYWAGPLHAHRLELTQTKGAVFVRYLPASAPIGDRRPRYLTVATYRIQKPHDFVTRAARQRDTVSRRAPGGVLAVWRAARPTSVYFARADSNRLVEIFDPDSHRAQDLALSGRIRAIRGD